MKESNHQVVPFIDRGLLREAIQSEYTEVACNVNHTIHFTSGRPLADRLQYQPEILNRLPQEAIRPFAGVGQPFAHGTIQANSIILDIGCGAGLDCLYSWILTSGSCEIFGLDMTESMLEKARDNARTIDADIRFIKGFAEEIPIPSNSIDIVISNGVINLCPDKEKVYREIYRILKPQGRFMIADVMLENPVPVESRELIHLWTNCVAGAIPGESYLELIRQVGFKTVRITDTYDVFKDARIARSASAFGARGYNISGIKPSNP